MNGGCLTCCHFNFHSFAVRFFSFFVFAFSCSSFCTFFVHSVLKYFLKWFLHAIYCCHFRFVFNSTNCATPSSTPPHLHTSRQFVKCASIIYRELQTYVIQHRYVCMCVCVCLCICMCHLACGTLNWLPLAAVCLSGRSAQSLLHLPRCGQWSVLTSANKPAIYAQTHTHTHTPKYRCICVCVYVRVFVMTADSPQSVADIFFSIIYCHVFSEIFCFTYA